MHDCVSFDKIQPILGHELTENTSRFSFAGSSLEAYSVVVLHSPCKHSMKALLHLVQRTWSPEHVFVFPDPLRYDWNEKYADTQWAPWGFLLRSLHNPKVLEQNLG
jgi:hypothetical protein